MVPSFHFTPFPEGVGAIGGLGSTVSSSSGVRGEAPAAVGFYSIQVVPEMLSEVKMLGLRNLISSDLEAFVVVIIAVINITATWTSRVWGLGGFYSIQEAMLREVKKCSF